MSAERLVLGNIPNTDVLMSSRKKQFLVLLTVLNISKGECYQGVHLQEFRRSALGDSAL